MKRNLFKTKMAVVMSAVLMLMPVSVNASTVAVAGGAGTTLTGNSTLVSPIYKVTLPAAIALAIDPMDISGAGSVQSVSYGVANLSNVPVLVDIELKASGKAGTSAAPTPAFEAFTSAGYLGVPGTTTRALQLAFVCADADTVVTSYSGANTTLAFKSISDADFEVDEANSPILIDLKASSPSAIKVSYVLAKTEYKSGTTQTLSASAVEAETVAAFTLKGSVNPFATWAAGDVIVTANYKLSGLPSAVALELTSGNAVYASGHNMVTATGLPTP